MINYKQVIGLIRTAQCPTCDSCGYTVGSDMQGNPEQHQCQWCTERDELMAGIEEGEFVGLTRLDSSIMRLAATILDYSNTPDILIAPGAVCQKTVIVKSMRELADKLLLATPELPPEEQNEQPQTNQG